MLEIICPAGIVVLDDVERDLFVQCILPCSEDYALFKEATIACFGDFEYTAVVDWVEVARDKALKSYRKNSNNHKLGADAIELNELHAKLCVKLKTGPRNTTKRYSMKEVIRRLRAGLSPEVLSDDIVYEDTTVHKKRKPRRSKIVCKRRKKGGKPK